MTESLPTDMLRALVSEGRNPAAHDIDLMPTEELVRCMNDEDRKVADAVATQLPAIAKAVDQIVAAFKKGGRLIYIGAGTSGRLGVLDASECPPTFSVPDGMVVGLIAGGDHALRHPIEGAEDLSEPGRTDLSKLNLNSSDIVVGIAVSGRTPYVMGGINYAHEAGAKTIGLTCNPSSPIAAIVDISIAPVVGPEVVTGSTRLKSGSAQKMVLNMLSTCAMVRMGKTYENLMVDLSISNEKLRTRAIGIVREVTGASEQEAAHALEVANGKVKPAILMELSGISLPEATSCLEKHNGILRQAIASYQKQ